MLQKQTKNDPEYWGRCLINEWDEARKKCDKILEGIRLQIK